MSKQPTATALESQDLLARERRRIVGLCATLTHNADVAEDLAQETLYEAWRHRDKLRDPARAAEWLSGIARNVCLRWRQRQRREEVHILSQGGELDGSDAMLATSVEALPDEQDIEAELERDELAQLLDRAMATLPPQTRTILEGHFIEGTAHAELALRLGMSENAVTVRLHRAKRALRRLLLKDFAATAESYAVDPALPTMWEETHIWCSICGRERLLGRLDRDTPDGEFALLCRTCYAHTGMPFHRSGASLLAGVSRYKPALSRVMAWSQRYYLQALQRGGATCLECGHEGILTIEQHFVHSTRPDGMRTLVITCHSCGSVCTQSLSGLILSLPESRIFRHAHPRLRTLPERIVETYGRPAVVTSFQSITDSAQIDVISALDTCDVLAIHGAAS